MALLDTLLRLTTDFVNRRVTLDNFHFELSDYVQDAYDSDDPLVRELFGTAFRLLGERGRRHRTSESARTELRDLVARIRRALPPRRTVVGASTAGITRVPDSISFRIDEPSAHRKTPSAVAYDAPRRERDVVLVFDGSAARPAARASSVAVSGSSSSGALLFIGVTA